MTNEELASLKAYCLHWGNNCGGCETCSQHFGKVPEYDFQTTHELICMIEELQAKVKQLEAK